MTTRKILINAKQAEETRVAIMENRQLFDFDIESINREQKKANIYKGTISRVEPSLNAIFVNYGAERHGFLPMKEIAPEYFTKKPAHGERVDLKTMVKEGQEIIIQINKEERGNKGAALSSFITLAGCYLVLMPNNERAGGISRRIEGEERTQLKEAMAQLNIPNGMGVIVRTNGMGRTPEELQWDLDALLKLWSAVQEANKSKKAPFLIYRESDVISRTIRDYLRGDVDEIIVDTEEAKDRVITHVTRLRPDFVNRVKLHKGDKPLFIENRVESQIETAYKREVTLPSGGSIVIDHTEALTSIDINSSRATKGEDIEETALQTNLEAAMEIARQARARDLGGLIVIDFIDMLSPRHQRDVEAQLHEAMKRDRARVQIGRISRFGLLELSRQRIRPSLGESTHLPCPRCMGQGNIRSVESLGLSIVRLIEEDAFGGLFREIQVELPVSVATYLLNEKREVLATIEQQRSLRIALIPNQHMLTPHYELRRFKKNGELMSDKSYQMIPKAEAEEHLFLQTGKQEEAAIKEVATEAAPRKPGLISRLIKDLFGSHKASAPKKAANQPRRSSGDRNSQNNQQRRRNNSRNNNRNRSNQDASGNQENRNRNQRNNNNRNRDNQNDTRRNDNRDNRNNNRNRNQNDQRDNRNQRNQNDKRDNRNENNESQNTNQRENRNDNQNSNQRNNRNDERRNNNRNSNNRDNRKRDDNRNEQKAQQTRPAATQQAKPAPVKKESVDRYEVKQTEKQHVASASVTEMLNKTSVLTDNKSKQTETRSTGKKVKQLGVELVESKTEFSIEEVRARMAKQGGNSQQVASKQSSQAQTKIQVDSEEV